jgi:saccharopine dehydrogenase-like NADP-dependent oxidoreductase
LKSVLVLGSGRSAPSLLRYLTSCHEPRMSVTIADKDPTLAKKYTAGQRNCQVLTLDITHEQERDRLVSEADIVLSMVPVRFHSLVLQSCLKYQIDLVTPSYESEEMRRHRVAIEKAGILMLNEIGLDPGIDHMSAMQMIDEIRDAGHNISAFESFTGGLMAPGYDDNPWQYKFTWNPRNVVLAGQGGMVRFLHNGKYKYIPYNKVFRRTERIEIDGYGAFEGYANRDSLSYIDRYGIKNVSTIYRGTLRRPGFCRAWDLLVQLGVTDDSFVLEGTDQMTHRQFINSFLPYNPNDSVELKLMQYLRIDQDSGLMEKLQSLGLFSDEIIGLKNATAAAVLEHILKKAWTMQPTDRDMIVMWHKLFYTDQKGQYFHKTSSLVAKGENSDHTAMARTVGLPMGIVARSILTKQINLKGLHIPVKKEIYQPVLKELNRAGITFNEKVIQQQQHEENKPIF